MKSSNVLVMIKGFAAFLVVLVVLQVCHGNVIDNDINDAVQHQQLAYDYYRHTCPEAENIISNMVAKLNKSDAAVPPRLLRMHFHDCFVRGCDGSVLINSTKNNKAEKDSPINNPSLKGFDVIDKIKAAVEAKCPGIVSCADILAYAARDAVHVAGKGRFPRYMIRGGRKDGRISVASEPRLNLPPPTANLTSLIRFFAAKRLSLQDMVILSGGHTIGVSSCKGIGGRQSNFGNSGKADPSLESSIAASIRKTCPRIDSTTSFVAMDSRSPLTMDNLYYVGVKEHKGVFTSDAALLTSQTTKQLVDSFINNPKLWAEEFVRSMRKMGELQVHHEDPKTAGAHEIRKKCYRIN